MFGNINSIHIGIVRTVKTYMKHLLGTEYISFHLNHSVSVQPADGQHVLKKKLCSKQNKNVYFTKKESAISTMWGIARMLTRGASFSTQKNHVQPKNVIIKSALKDTQRIANLSRLENVVNMVPSVNLNMKIRSKIMAKKKKTLMLKRKFRNWKSS